MPSVRAWIGLGANLGEPAVQIRSALERLAAHPRIVMLGCSRLYRSAPIGPAGQPDYCNAVCAVETTLGPADLLDALQILESAAGRDRNGPRWSARTLDLDLLVFTGVSLATARLTLPHPELPNRAFVLVPLAEIAPALEIPGHGRVDALAAAIDRTGLSPWH